MSVATIPGLVRQRVCQAFASRGWDDAEQPRETILLCDGGYCGRRFETPQGSAIWWIDAGRLELFDGEGSSLGPLALGPAVPAARKAA